MFYLTRSKILAIRIPNDEEYQIVGKDLTATMTRGVTVLSDDVIAYKFANSVICEIMYKTTKEGISTGYEAIQQFKVDDIVQIKDLTLDVVDDNWNILFDDSGNSIVLE